MEEKKELNEMELDDVVGGRRILNNVNHPSASGFALWLKANMEKSGNDNTIMQEGGGMKITEEFRRNIEALENSRKNH